MIVMAALQIHETHTALYEQPNSTSYYNPYVVSSAQSTAGSRLIYTAQNGDGPGTLWRKIEPFLVVTPIIIALSWVCLVFLFRELYHEFGCVSSSLCSSDTGLTSSSWAIFHVVGANPVMKSTFTRL